MESTTLCAWGIIQYVSNLNILQAQNYNENGWMWSAVSGGAQNRGAPSRLLQHLVGVDDLI